MDDEDYLNTIRNRTAPDLEDERSGQFVVRMPPALHTALGAKAGEQGVSLNQLVVALLAGGIGFTMEDPHAPR